MAARKSQAKCRQCGEANCCKTGAWVDLKEAEKIARLGLKGEFFQLEIDKDFPSGFRIGTSYGYNPCSFLDADGLCSIHKINYDLKPHSCKEFPYENDKLSPDAHVLCTLFRSKVKNKDKGHNPIKKRR